PECRSYFDRELEPRLSNANDLEWLGELGHRPKVNMLGHARALLVPLEWEEPFGLVMIEAMLVGTPVIAFARGSAPELIDEGVTGFLVRDQHQMAERIRQLAHIDRKRCRARALERWSSMRMAQDHVELYQQLLRERGRRSGLQRVAPHGRARASSDSGEILTVAANPSNVLAAVGTDRATRR
ncbi:MAG TPA: glycosyltransferase, partial [Polyangiales bacterium]|nr:glycosyltransferase [Polyangiales bacterium]